jgi:hypothetical protein
MSSRAALWPLHPRNFPLILLASEQMWRGVAPCPLPFPSVPRGPRFSRSRLSSSCQLSGMAGIQGRQVGRGTPTERFPEGPAMTVIGPDPLPAAPRVALPTWPSRPPRGMRSGRRTASATTVPQSAPGADGSPRPRPAGRLPPPRAAPPGSSSSASLHAGQAALLLAMTQRFSPAAWQRLPPGAGSSRRRRAHPLSPPAPAPRRGAFSRAAAAAAATARRIDAPAASAARTALRPDRFAAPRAHHGALSPPPPPHPPARLPADAESPPQQGSPPGGPGGPSRGVRFPRPALLGPGRTPGGRYQGWDGGAGLVPCISASQFGNRER